MEKVLIERESNGVVWVTINRESKRNAVDFDVMNRLSDIIQEVKENEHDKILVLTGVGTKAFCSGGDLSAFSSLYTRKDAYLMLTKMGEVLYQLFTLPKQTVALLNGIALGGGCELATACDYRLASVDSKFGFVQAKLGITTGWGGATLLFERLPVGRAMEMLTRAKIYTSNEGYDMGFIHHLLHKQDFRSEATAWLEEILEVNQGVLSAYKKSAILRWEDTNIRSRMFSEIAECAKLWELDEHHQAVKEFLNK